MKTVNFDKLSPAKKRILIAKDVIQRMRYRNVKQGKYFNSFYPSYQEYDVNKSAQNQVCKLEKGCQVCALGAIFMSHIKLFNKVSMSDLRVSSTEGLPFASNLTMHLKLKDYFPVEQLSLIECAFEISYSFTYDIASIEHAELRKKAALFGEKYCTPKTRLKAIMENIIKNKGEFIP